MASHREKYKYYLKTGKTHTNVVFLFDEFGIDNCKIELIENYPLKVKQCFKNKKDTTSRILTVLIRRLREEHVKNTKKTTEKE